MARPLIGLSTYREQARWGVWDQHADLLPTVYAHAIETAGGVPALLPPTKPYDEAATAAVARLDGLVISGGADVAPQRYDQDPHDRTTNWREDRDSWELALLDAADRAGVPVLGVCRGMQVMAVHAGGGLDQHVPDLVGDDRHNPAPGVFGETSVSVAPESRLASMIGTSQTVHCHHHQSVRDHPGFTAVAWADDGVLEAMEAPGDRLCVAVQWHPEMAADAGLFQALVDAGAGVTRSARPSGAAGD
ncbi:gamma-glutamyl-gamma-aminobutyrate hydrolase family protein [Nocardioides bizhenqiangii]|uniref:Gamma-glutamyl-gamma-aminobutyrate hydrolase family protein n=1 Tax=Nocardioides bizhenqiangii TaxID=3095076 RepID=A0ABZ0ZS61_9ACTN|nr:gamma-glutamyl-gamma-aminobutyrate hydrolase family protein [Nocardioides sp. HM61]WQQ27178.1 gamma-glutamyl-gamma-aminobutyrate hydrolase family protein [Nocardioides sp. HM61]